MTYSCTDTADNEAVRVPRIVIVGEAGSDATPPVITLTDDLIVTVAVGGQYADAGATCTDGVDGPLTPTSISTVNVNATGVYTVTYSCVDAARNEAVQVPRIVIVRDAVTPDTTLPVIILVGDRIVMVAVDEQYADEGATCTDGVDDSPRIDNRQPCQHRHGRSVYRDLLVHRHGRQ